MTIFRENTEDIYAGIEWNAGTPEARQFIDFLQDQMGVSTLRFPATSSIGVKPISEEGTKRLVRAALRHAEDQGSESLTLVHKGNIMKFTEGADTSSGCLPRSRIRSTTNCSTSPAGSVASGHAAAPRRTAVWHE